MAGAATDGDVLGARGSSANGPMAGSVGLTDFESTRVKLDTAMLDGGPYATTCATSSFR